MRGWRNAVRLGLADEVRKVYEMGFTELAAHALRALSGNPDVNLARRYLRVARLGVEEAARQEVLEWLEKARRMRGYPGLRGTLVRAYTVLLEHIDDPRVARAIVASPGFSGVELAVAALIDPTIFPVSPSRHHDLHARRPS